MSNSAVTVGAEYKLSHPEMKTIRFWLDPEGNLQILQSTNSISVPSDVIAALGVVLANLQEGAE